MNLNTKKLPFLAAALGFMTLILRAGLYLLGTDEKGLLIPWHFLDILCWAVTAGMVLIAMPGIRNLAGSRRYGDNFHPSATAALGSFAMAGGIAITVITGGDIRSRLDLIRNLLGLLSVPALLFVGLCRRQGKHPAFLFHTLVCLYLTLYSVSHYQTWCSQPQPQDYIFSMAGAVLLTLFAYYQTAFDAGLGKRQPQLLVGLLAGFFCIAALAGLEDVPLYLTGAVWSLTGLCSLTPVKRRPNPLTELKKEEPHESA